MTGGRGAPAARSSDGDIAAFLERAAGLAARKRARGKGRLIFALDATQSRGRTWDRACDIQAEMFSETAALGSLAIQLAWYRGFREFDASPFETDSAALLRRMTAVQCLGGRTQIARLLRHALAEAERPGGVDAVVFIGDCCEEEVDELCHLSGRLGLHGVPLFLFQEGGDPWAGAAFRQMAKLSGGACCRFDGASARLLRDLLQAVAVYAVGGRPALADFNRRTGRDVLKLPPPRRRRTARDT